VNERGGRRPWAEISVKGPYPLMMLPLHQGPLLATCPDGEGEMADPARPSPCLLGDQNLLRRVFFQARKPLRAPCHLET
jgi:hypothetical protein